jgi:NAD(P)-dependent dehydrogenase (short-subunit alcohol dehydrogenase family)
MSIISLRFVCVRIGINQTQVAHLKQSKSSKMTFGSFLSQIFTYPSWKAENLPDLTGKVSIVTGASAGVGKETALALAAKGSHVFCIGRNKAKTEKVVEEIKAATGNDKVEFIQADMMDLESARKAAMEFTAKKLPLHILVNNAGVMSETFELAKQGIETTWCVNFYAILVFTNELIPILINTPASRVVNVSSFLHTHTNETKLEDMDNKYDFKDAYLRYGRTKLALIHYTSELQNKVTAAGGDVYIK